MEGRKGGRREGGRKEKADRLRKGTVERKGKEEDREKERERDQGRQKSKPRGAGSPLPLPPPGLAAGRQCWGVGVGRRRRPGRKAECLRDVFIP